MDIPIPALHQQRKFPGPARGKLGAEGRETPPVMRSRLSVLRNEDSALAFLPHLYQEDSIVRNKGGLGKKQKLNFNKRHSLLAHSSMTSQASRVRVFTVSAGKALAMQVPQGPL